MTGYKSPLGKLSPEPTDMERMKSIGYWQNGILVIDMEHDEMDFVEREFFTRWAERRYARGRNAK